MYTQCPECKTAFRVTPEQLGAASGKVRCSRCNSIFNASQHLFTPEQGSSATPGTQQDDETDKRAAEHRQAETTPAAGEVDAQPVLPTEDNPSPASESSETETTREEPATEAADDEPPLDETVDLDIAEPEPATADESAVEESESAEDETPQDETVDLDIAEPEPATADESAVEESETAEDETPQDETVDLDLAEPEPAPADESAVEESETAEDETPQDETVDLDIAESEPAPADESTVDEYAAVDDEASLDETVDLDITEPEPAPADESAVEESETAEDETPQDETVDLDIAEPEPATADESAVEESETAEDETPQDETVDLDIAEPEPATADESAVEESETAEDETPQDEAFDLDITEPESTSTDEPSADEFEATEDEPSLDESFDLDTAVSAPASDDAAMEEPAATEDMPAGDEAQQTGDDKEQDDALGEDLFDLFNDEEPTAETAPETEPPGEEPPAATEERAQESTSPADWDPFSEESIESLLTPSDDAEELELNAVGQEGREVELSADELDLSADGTNEAAETSPRDADDELLNQRLPEDDAYHEMELEESGTTGDTATDAEAPPSGTTSENYSLPIEQQHKRSVAGTVLWGGGILILLAGLALQYLYYHRNALAENPTLRPLLAQMCGATGCTLPPRRALDKIELADHLMQFHPRYQESLLITATLVNRADFSQPFPVVEVVMTDLQQKVITRRHFRPEEYLIGDQPAQSFVPDTEIPLMLEVVDPGETAVGFEFNFY